MIVSASVAFIKPLLALAQRASESVSSQQIAAIEFVICKGFIGQWG